MGRGRRPARRRRAARWYGLAAERGHPGAQSNLALLFLEGRGVARDESAAAHWFLLAAERGSAPAQVRIGTMLEQDRGVPIDPVQAASWYRLAAEQGAPTARGMLDAPMASLSAYEQREIDELVEARRERLDD